MKKINILLLIVFVNLLFAQNFTKNDFSVFNSETEKEVSLNQMVKELKNYDVIFFGEWHDDKLIHSLEYRILQMISKDNDIAVSMEMFERDTQEILNQYLAGELEEQKFIKQSRAWPNYKTDYRKIIEFSKVNSLDVIAANVPRRYAAMVSRNGKDSIKKLPKEERIYIAKELKTLENEYKKAFVQTMKENMGMMKTHKMGNISFENFYAAQCLKDDTMAESIVKYNSKNPEYKIIHYNGNFHSESHLGTANKVHLLNPELKIAVITPVIVPEDKKIEFKKESKNLGDFLIFARRFSRENEKNEK